MRTDDSPDTAFKNFPFPEARAPPSLQVLRRNRSGRHSFLQCGDKALQSRWDCGGRRLQPPGRPGGFPPAGPATHRTEFPRKESRTVRATLFPGTECHSNEAEEETAHASRKNTRAAIRTSVGADLTSAPAHRSEALRDEKHKALLPSPRAIPRQKEFGYAKRNRSYPCPIFFFRSAIRFSCAMIAFFTRSCVSFASVSFPSSYACLSRSRRVSNSSSSICSGTG